MVQYQMIRTKMVQISTVVVQYGRGGEFMIPRNSAIKGKNRFVLCGMIIAIALAKSYILYYQITHYLLIWRTPCQYKRP